MAAVEKPPDDKSEALLAINDETNEFPLMSQRSIISVRPIDVV
jgi:hypothetical protein